MTLILASDLGRIILDNYTLSSSDPASPWLVAMALNYISNSIIKSLKLFYTVK